MEEERKQHPGGATGELPVQLLRIRFLLGRRVVGATEGLLLVFCGCALATSYVEVGQGGGSERPARRGLSFDMMELVALERGGKTHVFDGRDQLCFPCGMGLGSAWKGTRTVKPYTRYSVEHQRGF